MKKETLNPSTAKVKADKERIDRLKKQLRETDPTVDFERVRIMEKVYEETAGDTQIMRRAKFLAAVLEQKKLYIDDNLFVGSMAGSVNAMYTFPEWNIDWMKEENVVGNSKTPEDREANDWAIKYWEKRSMRPRVLEIFEKRYGFDPRPVYQAGLIAEFFSWPGGGGNLNYPKVYNEGLGSMLKDVKERQMALEMRQPNTSKLYFYEACQIVMKAVINGS
jgi:pyruvate-formate lyase